MRTRLRTPLRLALALIVTVALLWVADTAVAMRAEARLANQISKHNESEHSPRTYVGGFPFVQVFFTEELPSATVEFQDVELANLGLVTTRLEAADLEITGQEVLAGDLRGVPAQVVRRSVRFDAVAVGNLLGIADLDISHPEDISPGGGSATEALLQATLPGTQEPVSVITTLRLTDTILTMEVAEILAGPAELSESIRETFSLRVDTRDLPLGGRATAVYVWGGSIVVERSRWYTAVEEADLVPLPR